VTHHFPPSPPGPSLSLPENKRKRKENEEKKREKAGKQTGKRRLLKLSFSYEKEKEKEKNIDRQETRYDDSRNVFLVFPLKRGKFVSECLVFNIGFFSSLLSEYKYKQKKNGLLPLPHPFTNASHPQQRFSSTNIPKKKPPSPKTLTQPPPPPQAAHG
jgi:hypothetical protein